MARGTKGNGAMWLVIGAFVVGGALLATSAMAREPEPDTGGPEPDDPKLETSRMTGVVRPEGPGPDFSWNEWEKTSYDVPNKMPDDAKLRAQIVHDHILAPLRRYLGRPVRISSGYRSEELNRKVKGEPTSRHRTGEAVDIQVKGVDPESLAATILAIVPIEHIDQVIWYPRPDSASGGWVHVGIRVAEGNRGEVRRNLVSDKTPQGKVAYPFARPDPNKAIKAA